MMILHRRPSIAVIAALTLFLCAGVCAQPDRSAPPKLGPPPMLKLPPLQHLRLTNGLQVILLEKHTVPLVQVDILVKTGALMDPAGKSGLASMTAAMLTEGAGPRNALQLADAIDELGAQISGAAGQHTSGIDLHTPVAKLDPALVLLADITRRPAFAAPELDRKRKERLTTLMEWRDDPRMLATVVFNRTLYGSGHPYGVPSIGDQQSLKSITTDDLRKFHAGYYVPANATIIVVGDVTPAFILPRLEKGFGNWRGKAATPPSLPPIQQLKQKTLLIVDKPGAPQSVIQIGRVGAPRLTDDYYALVVMNTILGGSFSSRLNMNLREHHGYTYGAGSRFDFRPLAGPFVAAASVQTAVTDKSLTEFMTELRGILEPVSEEELDRAKNYVALSFPGDFQTVGQVAGEIENLVIYNLPDDYYNKYIGRILSVTKENVLRAAQKYINCDNLAFVVVGDRREIEETVTGLELAPERFLTVEDVLGPPPSLGTGK